MMPNPATYEKKTPRGAFTVLSCLPARMWEYGRLVWSVASGRSSPLMRQFQLSYSKGVTTRHSMCGRLEVLESRRLLSSALLVGGTLEVLGDTGVTNQITVGLDEAGSIVVSMAADSGPAMTQTFAFADVMKILMRGGGSNDNLAVDQGISIPAKICGLEGNDTITGGSGNDRISGGTGDDVIVGGAGNDMIHGQAGNDNISGGEGNDRIFGETGNDTLTGDAGKDVLHGGPGSNTINSDAEDRVIGRPRLPVSKPSPGGPPVGR